MDIEITWFRDDMKERVIDLFVNEYRVDKTEFTTLFNNFYYHSFQKNKCLLIVALDGDVVAGFQSFFYWPYIQNGNSFNSYQSGNSIIHPDYRGRGLFNKMLAFINKETIPALNFLIGFPVKTSLKNFLKDNWQNNFNLHWYIKLCNPLGFFQSGLLKNNSFQKGCVYFAETYKPENCFVLSDDSLFLEWRNEYMNKQDYYSFNYKKDKAEIIFHLKKGKRKKIINELIIGNIVFNSEGATRYLSEAFKELIKALRKSFTTHILSIALNEESSFNIKQSVLAASFAYANKSIYFITKSFTDNKEIIKPQSWHLLRGDIDTW